MIVRVIVLWIVAGALAGLAAGQERYIRPVDNASLDGSLLAFRTKLIAAAERRDLKYIMSIMDPNIELSFGGHSGLKGFRELWKDEAEFWAEFLPVIRTGGSFSAATEASGKMFSAPYTFSEWPDDLDAYEHVAVFGENVNLREAPSTEGAVLAKLSYNIVKVLDRKPKPGSDKDDWLQVETLGGKKGWIKAEYVRSPIDYRAGFVKKRGVWKMIYFIAGD